MSLGKPLSLLLNCELELNHILLVYLIGCCQAQMKFDLNYRHMLIIIIPLLPVPLILCLYSLYTLLCTSSWL